MPRGRTKGVFVEHLLHEVEIQCPVTSLPEKLQVNINHLEFGQHVTVGDLELPEGVTVLADPAAVVVQCVEAVEMEEVEAATETCGARSDRSQGGRRGGRRVVDQLPAWIGSRAGWALRGSACLAMRQQDASLRAMAWLSGLAGRPTIAAAAAGADSTGGPGSGRMKLVVGLGNPGRKYQQTRHNVGFEVLAEVARQHAAGPVTSRFEGELIDYVGPGGEGVVAVPVDLHESQWSERVGGLGFL